MIAQSTLKAKAVSTLMGAVLLATGLPAGKAQAHSDAELDAWLEQWSLAVARQGTETQELSVSLLKVRAAHPGYWGDETTPPPVPPVVATGPAPVSAAAVASGLPSDTERWRGLISAYFAEADMPWAMRVMACESGGNPDATNSSSGAAGLFQHLPKYWAERSSKAGVGGSTPYDPSSNVAVAAWLFYYGGGASHWVCK